MMTLLPPTTLNFPDKIKDFAVLVSEEAEEVEIDITPHSVMDYHDPKDHTLNPGHYNHMTRITIFRLTVTVAPIF